MDTSTKEEESSASSAWSEVFARKLRLLRNMVLRNQSPTEHTGLLSDSSRQSNGSPLPSNHTEEVYEELFKDSAPCPSCRGLGRVPKELENQLVALIPLKDDRLKPRRTILSVSIAVSLCAITAGLLIFFLMPRNIVLSSNRPLLEPTFIKVNDTPPDYFANFTVVNHYNVSNNNFYPVKISGVLMKGLYGKFNLAEGQAYKDEPLSISARSSGELSIPINFILKDDFKDLAFHCSNPWTWIHNLPILFELTTNYTYMGHSEQATLTTFQTVSCYRAPTTPTPITTVATTTTSTVKTTTHELTTTTSKATTNAPSIAKRISRRVNG